MASTKMLLRSAGQQRWAWPVGIAVSAVLIGAVAGSWHLAGWGSGSATGDSSPNPHAERSAGTATAESRTDVQLTPEKAQEAKLKLARAERRSVRETRTVPGEVDYDAAKHLDVTAPVVCIVKRVLAEPGQMVRQGDPLVIMSSAEVGLARVDIHSRAADLELAKREHVWSLQVADNVEQLLKWLPERPKLAELELQLADRPLGDYREKLMSAYSKLIFAEFAAATGELENRGGIARRVIEERRSNREVAAATFQSACETARFDSTQGHRKAHAGQMQAARLLSVSRERLATLLGPQAETVDVQPDVAPDVTGDVAAPPVSPSDQAADSTPSHIPMQVKAGLSEFILLAPFAGRIEERQAVVAARAQAGDSLFTLADTATLWVKAEIHERDWKSLQFASSGPIPIRVPALGDAHGDAIFATMVRYVGARVSPVSRSVPLVTELNNERGLFKPGMFVWVDVPLEDERQALVVPSGAVTRHEGQAFVFVPLRSEQFRRVNVETGLESGGFIEVLRGLESGQEVVEQGVFFLKSELLLEREVE